MSEHRCGNCFYYRKWKHGERTRGLCELLDCASPPDSARNCPYWFAKPYKDRISIQKHSINKGE